VPLPQDACPTDSEDMVAALLDAVHDGIFVHDDPTGEVLAVNRRAEEMFGLPADELRRCGPDRTSSGQPPYSAAEAMAWLERARRDGPQLFPWRARHADGHLFWVEVSLRLALVAGGRRLVAVVRDVDARIRAEQARAASEARLRAVIDSIPYPIFSKGLDLRYDECNSAFASYLGRTREALIGSSVFDLTTPAQAEIYDRADRNLLATGGQQIYEAVVLAAGREERHVIFHKTLLLGPDGSPSGIVGIMVDTTDRRQLEARLLQSEKLRVLGQLAGGVAHDFNNMLAAIQGAAEMLGSRCAAVPDTARPLHMILEATQRASSLTGRLLGVARRKPQRDDIVDLHREVATVGELLAQTIDRRIAIVTRLEARRHLLRGDAAALQNAILNLAINARDAMPDGGTLTFSSRDVMPGDPLLAEHHQPDVRHIALAISDTGHGIPESVRSHIFEPFLTTKEPGRGTGLGLASVQASVLAHHGCVTFATADARGTTFTILLPVPDLALPAAAPAPPVRSVSLSHCTVLVADDEAILRLLLCSMLGECGARVLTASDGAAALDLYRREGSSIDLCILDASMPGRSGIDVLHAIHDIDPQARVIITSGYAGDAAIYALEAAGQCRFLPKPYHRETLLGAIAQCLA